jgi:hypothetical protein
VVFCSQLTKLCMMICCSGFWRRVDLSVDDVSEKHAVSIFRTFTQMNKKEKRKCRESSKRNYI